LARAALLILLLLAAATASAQVSGGLSALSDYRFRGISLSDRRPALQGWLTYDHPSGLYAGALLSTVHIYAASSEVAGNLYGGYAYAISPRAALDVAVARYFYPESTVIGSYDFTELSVGAALDRVRTRLSVSNDYFGSGSRTAYLEVEGTLPLTEKLSLIGHAGGLWRSDSSQEHAPGPPRFQFDGKVGVLWEVLGFGVELSVVGTDVPRSRCPGSDQACETGVVLAISREF
jgi:uncharacterized protein (TIGR02001 family)